MSTEAAQAFIDTLSERQQRAALSDRQMAIRLGISPAHWHRLKRGERQPSVMLLRAAIREFSLSSKVLDFLDEEVAGS